MFNKLIEKINNCEKNIKYSEDLEGNYKSLIYSYPILKYGEERSLFKLYKKTNDKLYKDIIFKCHLRDVYDCCTDITGYKLDLVSEGNILMYELINTFDYDLPYMNFSKYIKTRLINFYEKMIDDNNNSLDIKMSIEELKEHEENGECLTNTSEINHRIIKKEKLTIIINESINIVYDENDEDYLYKKMFNTKPKKLFNRPFKNNNYNGIDY